MENILKWIEWIYLCVLRTVDREGGRKLSMKRLARSLLSATIKITFLRRTRCMHH